MRLRGGWCFQGGEPYERVSSLKRLPPGGPPITSMIT